MAKNRSELVSEVAGKAGTSQAAVNSVLDALFEVFETSSPLARRSPSRVGSPLSAPTALPARAATRRPARPSRSPLATASS